MGREVVHEERPSATEKQEDKEELYLPVSMEPRVPKFSRREKFVDEILTEHPLLARSMVNRVWALLMGRGIVHPPERMDSDHPPSHPALLDWLARDFREHGYDIKRLVRQIVRSQAYQLDSRVPESGQPSSFAYGLEKPLTAEALIRSMAVALEVDISDSEVTKQFRKLFPDILPENNLTTLNQSMMLSNRAELQRLFDEAAKKMSADQMVVKRVQQLYRRVFGRDPADDELFAISDYVRARSDRPVDALSQVLWAMVCSAEFRLNH